MPECLSSLAFVFLFLFSVKIDLGVNIKNVIFNFASGPRILDFFILDVKFKIPS